MTDPAGFEIRDTEEREGALVRDIRIAAPEGTSPIEAYLVEPSLLDARTSRPGLLFAHWFDTHAPNGNRTEYVDEAVDWARRHSAACVLPQLTFPWAADPTDAASDTSRIADEVARLRACLDVLVARPAVDPTRLAVVGHDFGAMHAAILATADRRPSAYVLVAAVPRWGDWFLPFWPIGDDRIEYLRSLRPLDPVEHVAAAAPARMLFQYGLRDFFIAPMTGRELARAAGESGTYKDYPDAEHDMAAVEIVADRTAFLEEALGVSRS